VTSDIDDVKKYIGQSLFDDEGHKIGKIGTVFLDDATSRPQWVSVATGFFGTNESVVPVAEASAHEDGLAVPYSKDTVKDAPNVDVESGLLTDEQEAELYRFYGLEQGVLVPKEVVPAEAEAADDVWPEDAVVTEDVAPDAVPATDGIPPEVTDRPDDESNAGRTDLVQRDADYDDDDATGLSAGPTNRRGTEIEPEPLDRPRTE
jgi:hypothetical protein